MGKFRKKPVVIEAIQYNGLNHAELVSFTNGQIVHTVARGSSADGKGGIQSYDKVEIPTLEGNMLCSENDWVIKGVKGEFYPCKPDIFEATYTPATEPETITFSKKAWDSFKSMLGDRNYQGLINIEDLVEITAKLETSSF